MRTVDKWALRRNSIFYIYQYKSVAEDEWEYIIKIYESEIKYFPQQS